MTESTLPTIGHVRLKLLGKTEREKANSPRSTGEHSRGATSQASHKSPAEINSATNLSHRNMNELDKAKELLS